MIKCSDGNPAPGTALSGTYSVESTGKIKVYFNGSTTADEGIMSQDGEIVILCDAARSPTDSEVSLTIGIKKNN